MSGGEIAAKAALILNGDAGARNAYAADLARYVLAIESARADAIASLHPARTRSRQVECIDCGKPGTHRVCQDCFARTSPEPGGGGESPPTPATAPAQQSGAVS